MTDDYSADERPDDGSADFTFHDRNGNVVTDRTLAVSAEIHTVDRDGIETGRTYLELAQGQRRCGPRPSISWAATDEEIAIVEQGDLAKTRTWDLWAPDNDGGLSPLVTVQQLLVAIGAGASVSEQVAAIKHMRTLPSWQAAPRGLKRAVRQWLARHARDVRAST